MTTLQAAGVMLLGLVVAGFLPRYEIGAGFFVNLGNGAVALAMVVAALSPKKSRARERKRRRGAPPGAA